MHNINNHVVTQALGARMSACEKTLDVAEKITLDTQVRDRLLALATRDLDAMCELMNALMEHQTEWQVSAFHDQYDAMRARVGALAITRPNTTTL